MSLDLLTDTELAERFDIDLDEFHRLRVYNRWPSVKLGRNVFRFTQAQVEIIVAAMTVEPGRRVKTPKVEGQTKGSQARSV